MKKPHQRYSPAFWPAARLPVPLIGVGAPVTLTREGWLKPDTKTTGLVPVEVPDEFHLRQVMDVDLTLPEAIAAFVSEFGPIGDPGSIWRSTVGGIDDATADAWHDRRHRAWARAQAGQLGYDEPEWDTRPAGATHLVEEAGQLADLRRLVTHVTAALADEPVAPIWQEAGYFDRLDEDVVVIGHYSLADLSPEIAAWHFFSLAINRGLDRLAPRVYLPEDAYNAETSWTCAHTVVCVLLFNDLFDGVPYRRCADETCGRLFRHQVGRGAGAVRRIEGVAYCSPQHARNQSQRERRRRARATAGGA